MPKFVVHDHHAMGPAGHHHDLRIEKEGVLLCWVVPKLVEPRIKEKRLAIKVQAHVLEVLDFEGEIEEGYGAGMIRIWDSGEYEFVKPPSDVSFKINFKGKKLKGIWILRQFGDKKENFLLFKGKEV